MTLKPTRKLMSSEDRDAFFIQNPGEWPRWPLLPLKRRVKAYHEVKHFCGFLFAQEAPPYRVYLGSIFNLCREGDNPNTWAEALAKFPVEEFEELEDLLEEWRVD